MLFLFPPRFTKSAIRALICFTVIKRTSAFPQEQQIQLSNLGNEIAANSRDLLYPFFAIEFKADDPGTSGSLWVATNQCVGASASCVNIAEKLNQQLRQCQNENITLLDTTAFSIAMSGTEARLYVSWKHNELDYYVQKLNSYLLQNPKDYIEFRKHVLNIIDWGKDKRLKEIQRSLDFLLEENRKSVSGQLKCRTPPLSSSDHGPKQQKRRSTSSSETRSRRGSRGNERKTHIQEQEGVLERSAEPQSRYWILDPASNRYYHIKEGGAIIWGDERK